MNESGSRDLQPNDDTGCNQFCACYGEINDAERGLGERIVRVESTVKALRWVVEYLREAGQGVGEDPQIPGRGNLARERDGFELSRGAQDYLEPGPSREVDNLPGRTATPGGDGGLKLRFRADGELVLELPRGVERVRLTLRSVLGCPRCSGRVRCGIGHFRRATSPVYVIFF